MQFGFRRDDPDPIFSVDQREEDFCFMFFVNGHYSHKLQYETAKWRANDIPSWTRKHILSIYIALALAYPQ